MFLTPGAKLAQKVDVNTALYNTIASTRGEAAAAKAVPACRAFQELRAALHEPPTTAVTSRAIKRYLANLHYTISESSIPAAIPADLLWVNAFDGNDHCVVRDLAIDHVSALFNLSVCEATLATAAYRTRRTDRDAKKSAVTHFRNAAGYFQAASELPAPGGIRAITCDLYPPALKALEMVMLGNAQQTLYEIMVESGNPSHFLARFAMGARDFYLIAEECCREPDVVNTCINGYVGRPAGALAAYFDVVAQSAQANAAGESYDMPQQLARLTKAEKSADECMKIVQALETSALASVGDLKTKLLAELNLLQRSIREQKEVAEQENRTIYYASPAESVPEIEGRRSVKPADVSSVLKEEPVDKRLLIFDELPEPVSSELSGLASTYVDLVASTVADSVASINTAAAHLHELVIQVESSVSAVRTSAAEPTQTTIPATSSYGDDLEAINKIHNAQEKGGLGTLREMQTQAFTLGTETKLQVQSIDAILHAEEVEDEQFRARVPGMTRPASASVAASYHAKLSQIRRNLEQAANADRIVASQIDEHASAISQLDAVDVQGFTPPSAPSAIPQDRAEAHRVEALVSEMMPEIAKGKKQLATKDEIVQELEKKKHLDNPYAATVGLEDADVDKCTALIEKEYSMLKQRASDACAEMARISQFLTDTNARLKMPTPEGSAPRNAQLRMNEVFRHQAAALKFEELRGHLEQGINFYTKEQDVVQIVKREIEGFVAARRLQAMDISRASPHSRENVPGHPQHGALYPPGHGQYPPAGSPYAPNNPYPHGTHDPSQSPYGGQPPYQGQTGAWRRQ